MNELIPMNQLSPSKFDDDATFNSISTSTSYLPRLQLFGSNSEHVKCGRIPMAHYGLVLSKDRLEDLGDIVEVCPISFRPKAMRMKSDNSAPESFFDPKSPDFLKIKDSSKDQDSGCSYGPEFLLYIPSVQRFATYFMNSETSRRQAPELRALLRRGATLKVQLIKTTKYSWHGPVVTPCLSLFDVPPMEEVIRQKNKFDNPEDSDSEFNTEELDSEPSRVR